MRNYYVPGQWNVVCMRCGLKKKSAMLRKEWTGLMVCDDCWEPRHPQTLIRVPEEVISPPWKSPEVDSFTASPYLNVESPYNLDDPILTEIGIPLNIEDS